jgi:hypothetical protein
METGIVTSHQFQFLLAMWNQGLTLPGSVVEHSILFPLAKRGTWLFEDATRHVNVEIGYQVGLVEQHQVGGMEHVGVLKPLVFSHGD